MATTGSVDHPSAAAAASIDEAVVTATVATAPPADSALSGLSGRRAALIGCIIEEGPSLGKRVSDAVSAWNTEVITPARAGQSIAVAVRTYEIVSNLEGLRAEVATAEADALPAEVKGTYDRAMQVFTSLQSKGRLGQALAGDITERQAAVEALAMRYISELDRWQSTYPDGDTPPSLVVNAQAALREADGLRAAAEKFGCRYEEGAGIGELRLRFEASTTALVGARHRIAETRAGFEYCNQHLTTILGLRIATPDDARSFLATLELIQERVREFTGTVYADHSYEARLCGREMTALVDARHTTQDLLLRATQEAERARHLLFMESRAAVFARSGWVAHTQNQYQYAGALARSACGGITAATLTQLLVNPNAFLVEGEAGALAPNTALFQGLMERGVGIYHHSLIRINTAITEEVLPAVLQGLPEAFSNGGIRGILTEVRTFRVFSDARLGELEPQIRAAFESAGGPHAAIRLILDQPELRLGGRITSALRQTAVQRLTAAYGKGGAAEVIDRVRGDYGGKIRNERQFIDYCSGTFATWAVRAPKDSRTIGEALIERARESIDLTRSEGDFINWSEGPSEVVSTAMARLEARRSADLAGIRYGTEATCYGTVLDDLKQRVDEVGAPVGAMMHVGGFIFSLAVHKVGEEDYRVVIADSHGIGYVRNERDGCPFAVVVGHSIEDATALLAAHYRFGPGEAPAGATYAPYRLNAATGAAFDGGALLPSGTVTPLDAARFATEKRLAPSPAAAAEGEVKASAEREGARTAASSVASAPPVPRPSDGPRTPVAPPSGADTGRTSPSGDVATGSRSSSPRPSAAEAEGAREMSASGPVASAASADTGRSEGASVASARSTAATVGTMVDGTNEALNALPEHKLAQAYSVIWGISKGDSVLSSDAVLKLPEPVQLLLAAYDNDYAAVLGKMREDYLRNMSENQVMLIAYTSMLGGEPPEFIQQERELLGVALDALQTLQRGGDTATLGAAREQFRSAINRLDPTFRTFYIHGYMRHQASKEALVAHAETMMALTKTRPGYTERAATAANLSALFRAYQSRDSRRIAYLEMLLPEDIQAGLRGAHNKTLFLERQFDAIFPGQSIAAFRPNLLRGVYQAHMEGREEDADYFIALLPEGTREALQTCEDGIIAFAFAHLKEGEMPAFLGNDAPVPHAGLMGDHEAWIEAMDAEIDATPRSPRADLLLAAASSRSDDVALQERQEAEELARAYAASSAAAHELQAHQETLRIGTADRREAAEIERELAELEGGDVDSTAATSRSAQSDEELLAELERELAEEGTGSGRPTPLAASNRRAPAGAIAPATQPRKPGTAPRSAAARPSSTVRRRTLPPEIELKQRHLALQRKAQVEISKKRRAILCLRSVLTQLYSRSGYEQPALAGIKERLGLPASHAQMQTRRAEYKTHLERQIATKEKELRTLQAKMELVNAFLRGEGPPVLKPR